MVVGLPPPAPPLPGTSPSVILSAGLSGERSQISGCMWDFSKSQLACISMIALAVDEPKNIISTMDSPIALQPLESRNLSRLNSGFLCSTGRPSSPIRSRALCLMKSMMSEFWRWDKVFLCHFSHYNPPTLFFLTYVGETQQHNASQSHVV